MTRNEHGRIKGRKALAIRKRRMQRTGWLCEDCLAKDRPTPASAVDHIVPLSKGGADVDANTRNLCRDCHEARTAEQFGFKRKARFGADGWPE
jgi:5-methylcytosine-specific restriction enzyme A